MDMTGWLTADEAASLLGVSRKSIYDYALRLKGFPPPTRIGRTVLWRERDLTEWRAAHPPRNRRI